MEEGQLTAREEMRRIRVRGRGGGETSSYSGRDGIRMRDREGRQGETERSPPGTQIIWRRKNNGRAIK